MKRRISMVIGIAIAVALTLIGIRLAMMSDVPVDEFDTFLRSNSSIEMLARSSSAPESLPLLVRIGFSEYDAPGSSLEGGLGSPDRTDVFELGDNSDRFECRVHFRPNQVCLVTLEKSPASGEFRERLESTFPGLEIDW